MHDIISDQRGRGLLRVGSSHYGPVPDTKQIPASRRLNVTFGLKNKQNRGRSMFAKKLRLEPASASSNMPPASQPVARMYLRAELVPGFCYKFEF